MDDASRAGYTPTKAGPQIPMKGENRVPVRVFLVNDHPAVKDDVRAYLSKQSSVAVVGESSNGREALREVKKLSPQVILLNVIPPGRDAVELTRRLRRLAPKAKVVAFSGHAGRELVVNLARCGVRGYVVEDRPTARLVDALMRVAQGELMFPPGRMDAVRAASAAPAPDIALTPREREVLSLLCEGLTNKEAGRRLGIGVRTVETHRERLSHKLNIATVAGLTKYAIQHGLTPLKASASQRRR